MAEQHSISYKKFLQLYVQYYNQHQYSYACSNVVIQYYLDLQ